MKYSIAGLCLTFATVFGALAYAAPQQPAPRDKQLETLGKEEQKLKSESDPIDVTKSDIRIAAILLTLVNNAVETGDLKTMRDRIKDYSATIENAHHMMMSSGRDAKKKPAGFKELEIALRGQIRRLQDIGGALTFDQRDPVEKARQQASDIRDELLKALFGSQNAPHHS